jgi:hypothetical protein
MRREKAKLSLGILVAAVEKANGIELGLIGVLPPDLAPPSRLAFRLRLLRDPNSKKIQIIKTDRQLRPANTASMSLFMMSGHLHVDV